MHRATSARFRDAFGAKHCVHTPLSSSTRPANYTAASCKQASIITVFDLRPAFGAKRTIRNYYYLVCVETSAIGTPPRRTRGDVFEATKLRASVSLRITTHHHTMYIIAERAVA